MSILIKGMKMPKEGFSVVVDLWNNGKAYVYGTGNAEMYEAIELPDHGDLIDRDKLKHGFCVECTLYPDNCLGENCDWGSIYHIEHAPVVIPAERSKDGET